MKREIVNWCHSHKMPFEECPGRCGYAFHYFYAVECRLKREARELLQSQRPKRVKKIKPEKIALFCQECSCEIVGYRRKYCTIKCRAGSAKKRKSEKPKIKTEWIPKIKACRKCKAEFLAKHPSSSLCSDSCRWNRAYVIPNRPQKHCVECHQPMEYRKHLFCGDACRKINNNKVDREKRKANKKPTIIYSHCEHCKKETGHSRRYCDDKCLSVAGRIRLHQKWREENPIKPAVEVNRTCHVCQSEFTTIHPTKKFCGKRCKLKDARKKRRVREKGKPKSNHVRIKNRLSNRLRELLQRRGLQKTSSITKYIGFSPKEMLAHVEKQLDGTDMNWSNYGVFGWHLDHIIPCSYFDMTNEEHLVVCFNWRNIRPLWGKDNQERQDNVSLFDAMDIPKELFEMATRVGIKLWV